MKLLLIHNRFHWDSPITWLSLFIRVFTCSKWNHIALEVDGNVIESVAKGVVLQKKEYWLSKSDRLVQELIVPDEWVKADVYSYLGKPYGLFDLLRIGVNLIQERWLGLDPPRRHNSHGMPCTELAGAVLGLQDAHLLTPESFAHLGLHEGLYYETFKR